MSAVLTIRADSNEAMGTGHVMRMLALAEAWKSEGGTVQFVACDMLPAIQARVESSGFAFKKINAAGGSAEDAKETAKHAADSAWCILDGYQFNETYQETMKRSGTKILVIDDEAKSPRFHAHAVLNQNFYARDSQYQNSAPEAKHLMGLQYALLRTEFLKAHKSKQHPETASKLLVTFGGSDPANLNSVFIKSMELIPIPLEIKLVVGPGAKAVQPPHSKTHRLWILQQPQMADLMQWADFALAASGSTCWELCALGVPSLVISAAPNQVPIAESLDRAGIMQNLGHAETLTPQHVAEELIKFAKNRSKRKEMADRGKSLVDGKGALRTVQFLKGAAA